MIDNPQTVGSVGEKPTRRRFMRMAALAGVGALGWSGLIEPRLVRVDRVVVPLPGLPEALDGFRIAQLSDLHRGPTVSVAHIRRGIDLALSVRPDLIVLTGDFVSISADYLATIVPELSRLRAPHGVFAVLGNHDYWTDRITTITDGLTTAGARVLVNAHEVVEVAGNNARPTPLAIVGVDDLWSGQPDLDRALAGKQRDAFPLLLAHEPDFADEAATRDLPLQLSGHSHGGQVRLPFIGALKLPKYGKKYPIGLQRVPRSRTLVYTNRGLGYVNDLPFRFNCPPEVTEIVLRKSVD